MQPTTPALHPTDLSARTLELRKHAQGQDPQWGVEAVPAYRYREDRPPESRSPASSRAQSEQTHPATGRPHARFSQRHKTCQFAAERLNRRTTHLKRAGPRPSDLLRLNESRNIHGTR